MREKKYFLGTYNLLGMILDALIFENSYILVSYEFSKLKALLIECFSHLTINWPAAKETGHRVQLGLY